MDCRIIADGITTIRTLSPVTCLADRVRVRVRVRLKVRARGRGRLGDGGRVRKMILFIEELPSKSL